jgi:hypothetical protein
MELNLPAPPSRGIFQQKASICLSRRKRFRLRHLPANRRKSRIEPPAFRVRLTSRVSH